MKTTSRSSPWIFSRFSTKNGSGLAVAKKARRSEGSDRAVIRVHQGSRPACATENVPTPNDLSECSGPAPYRFGHCSGFHAVRGRAALVEHRILDVMKRQSLAGDRIAPDSARRTACRRRTRGWKRQSASDGGCGSAIAASVAAFPVRNINQVYSPCRPPGNRAPPLRPTVIPKHSAEEPRRRKLFADPPPRRSASARARAPSASTGWTWLASSTSSRSNSIAPGSRYWATEIGLIINTGLMALTPVPACAAVCGSACDAAATGTGDAKHAYRQDHLSASLGNGMRQLRHVPTQSVIGQVPGTYARVALGIRRQTPPASDACETCPGSAR